MNIFSNEDIVVYLSNHVHIKEFDKIKNISILFRKIFDLRYLLSLKKYKILLGICGCTSCDIINIIHKNVLKKYKFRKNKKIFDIVSRIQNDNLANMCINSDYNIIIEYVFELLYNITHKKYENILNIFISMDDNLSLLLYNSTHVTMFICLSNFIVNIKKDFTKKYYKTLKSLYADEFYKLNIGIFTNVLIKKFNISLLYHITSELKIKTRNILFEIHNENLGKYLKGFKKDEKDELYYNMYPVCHHDTINILLNKLYISK